MNGQNVTGISVSNNNLNSAISIGSNNLGTSQFELYSGGFVGISENNIEMVKEDIKSLLLNPIQSTLDSFTNTEESYAGALKGQAQIILVKYIDAIKNLVYAYTSTLNNFITLADSALASMKENDAGNSEIINAASDEIKNLANGLNIE